jgi:large subunit ribosomal protein L10
MQKSDKERVVAELTERLRTAETLIVADYRGLTNAEIDGLRSKLIEHGARFAVVKNTLTRRAAEAAGADALLALLEGPTAIAFVESDGDPVAVAKALGDAANETKVLAIRGGLLEGAVMSAGEVESLAKLPPAEVLRAQLVGAIVSPLTTVVALVAAPLRDLVGLIDARIAQLREQGDTSESGAPAAEAAQDAPADEAPAEETAAAEPAAEETPAEETAAAEPAAEAEAEPEAEASADEAPAETAEETIEETTENQEEQK